MLRFPPARFILFVIALSTTVVLLAEASSAPRAFAKSWEMGINDPYFRWKDAAIKEKGIENIEALGATWIRIVPSSGSSQGVANFVDAAQRAKNLNLKVLANINQLDDDYDGGNVDAPLNHSGWRAKKLSQINLGRFSQRLQALCKALKKQGVDIDAFEIGNECDQNAYDADVPDGHAATPDELHTWLRGYGHFLKTASQILQAPQNFPKAQIITFGIAHSSNQKLALSNPAHWVARLSNVEGYNYLDNESYHVDGFGCHFYPSPNDTARGISLMVNADAKELGTAKPIWITECGFLNPDKDFPNRQHQSFEQGLTVLFDTVESLHHRLWFGPVFFYELGWLVDDRGNLRPLASVLAKRAASWKQQ